jgi:alpha-glucosidase (family GH31 glycosyl hydrolase)
MKNKDFALDTQKIKDVSALKKTLSANNQKLVAYVDAAITMDPNNPAYSAGTTNNAFIQSSLTGSPLINLK